MEKIIGATISEAQELMTGHIIRVSIKNGKRLMGTCDYRPNRINVEMQDDTIIKIVRMG